MMMLAIIAAMALVGSGAQQPSQNHRELMADWDRAMASDPCVRRQGDGWKQLRFRDCLKFGPKQRIRGVWYNGFEESGFVPNVQSVPFTRNLLERGGKPEFDTYLDIDRVAALRRIRTPPFYRCTQAISIEFIGRRALKRGAYHTGTDDEVIVVDRVIRGRFLGVVRSVGPKGWEKRTCERN